MTSDGREYFDIVSESCAGERKGQYKKYNKDCISVQKTDRCQFSCTELIKYFKKEHKISVRIKTGDARHLEELFKEHLDQEKIKKYKELIRQWGEQQNMLINSQMLNAKHYPFSAKKYLEMKGERCSR